MVPPLFYDREFNYSNNREAEKKYLIMFSRSRPPFNKIIFIFLSGFVAAGLSCSLFDRGDRAHTQSLSEVRTFAGINREFGEPFGLAFSGTDIFVSDGERSKILRVAADGSVSTFVENLNTPSAIAFAPNGDLITADTGSHTIKRVASDGNITVVAGVPNRSGFSDGEATSAFFNGPIGVAVGPEGRIYVADTYNDRIRVIEDGRVRTLAGSTRGFADGADAKFDTPLGLAIWHDKILVADSGNRRIRVVEPDGKVWTLAGSGDSHLKDGTLASAGFVNPTAIAVDGSQAIFVADGNAIRTIGRRNFPLVETISDDRRGFSDGPSFTSRFNRPSGLAFDPDGDLLIADSDNQAIRMASDTGRGMTISTEQKEKLRYTPEEFRGLQPARWPFDPPERTREIAGTLGEVRGVLKGDDDDSVWFHNGLDIAGGYGETARFVRSETVLDPQAIENLGTTRELIRMPTMGYIHIRLGRDKDERFYQESSFIAEIDTGSGKPTHLRIPRGTHFNAGDPIGTLNSLNHVHLIAGCAGSEMNALDALTLPGVSDSITPTIEQVRLLDPDWSEPETEAAGKRIMLRGKTRVVVRARTTALTEIPKDAGLGFTSSVISL